MPTDSTTPHPRIVSQAEWQTARDALMVKEKAATRARDALAAERRRLPMVKIDKDYVFKAEGGGEVSLTDLFEGRRQLIVYHFMYAPGVHGWREAGCPGCSWFVDQIGHLAHLNARGVSFTLISSGPLERLLAYKTRMGWTVPWVSSEGTSFNADFDLTRPDGETFGLSVLFRQGEDAYRTWFTAGRGAEMLGGAWSFLDLVPYGRQETWEDSPEGWPQSEPYQWWRRHDEYGVG